MKHTTISRLRELGSHVGSPIEHRGIPGDFEHFLPEDHRSFLSQLNGLTVTHGAYRLLGFRPDGLLDLAHWNLDATWRFVWGSRLNSYLFFGGTAWGDQYAYELDEDGVVAGPHVQFFEANSMRPKHHADSFTEFIEEDFLRNAIEPYDLMTVQALEVAGAIDPRQQWTLSPSIVLGASEDLNNLITLPADTAMIFAGDLASAVDDAPTHLTHVSVSPWTDSVGRPRLRANFA